MPSWKSRKIRKIEKENQKRYKRIAAQEALRKSVKVMDYRSRQNASLAAEIPAEKLDKTLQERKERQPVEEARKKIGAWEKHKEYLAKTRRPVPGPEPEDVIKARRILNEMENKALHQRADDITARQAVQSSMEEEGYKREIARNKLRGYAHEMDKGQLSSQGAAEIKKAVQAAMKPKKRWWQFWK